MRYFMILLVAVPMSLALGQTGGSDAKKELEKFQGSWHAVTVINIDGKPATDEEARHTTIVIKGNTFVLQDKKNTIRGTFTIDPTRVPKAIEFTLEGSKPGEKFLGIYRYDGELRRSCFVVPGKERPKEFPTDAKGYLQFVWKPQPK